MRYIILCLVLMLLSPLPADAQTAAITDRGVTLDFPNSITFQAQLPPNVDVADVTIEYAARRRTCGDEVIALATPQADPDTPGSITWTWDLQFGEILPPGTTIQYRWRLKDGAAGEFAEFVWLDDTYSWRAIERDGVNLFWYDGSTDFAEDLHTTAVQSIRQLDGLIGVTPDRAIDLYIYADSEAMRSAIVGAPGWAGGVAFPDYSITIIGINEQIIEWGRSTITHELTHLLIGQLGGPCGGLVPTWLNEGIAVYNEGALDVRSAIALGEAVQDETVLSVRALSGAFSAHPERADIAYSQSYSLVRFLVDTYGRPALLDLFAALSSGESIDAAMTRIYGFDQNGLDARWRAQVGAAPRDLPAVELPQATPLSLLDAQAQGRPPLPTVQPTLAPASVPTEAPLAVAPQTTTPAVVPATPPLLPLVLSALVFVLGFALSSFAAVRLLGSYRAERRSRGQR